MFGLVLVLQLKTSLGHVRLGLIRNKNNWNNASKRLFGSYSHSGIPGFHSGFSAPRSRIAGICSGIHSYSGIFPNKRALNHGTLWNKSTNFQGLAFIPHSLTHSLTHALYA